jgi:hypothetical protein
MNARSWQITDNSFAATHQTRLKQDVFYYGFDQNYQTNMIIRARDDKEPHTTN